MKNFYQNFKASANGKTLSFHDIIMTAIFRAVASNRTNKFDMAMAIIHRGMTPVTNEKKLANGQDRYHAMYCYSCRWGYNSTRTEFPKNMKVYGEPVETFFDTEEEAKEAFSLWNKIISSSTKDTLDRFYSYVFVRNGMSPEQIAVQASHVAFVAGGKFAQVNVDGKPDHSNVYFVLVGCDNLNGVEKHLNSLGVQYNTFIEPDMGNVKTAIFTMPLHFSQRGPLTNYPKLVIPLPNAHAA